MVDQQFINSLPASVKEQRIAALNFISLMKQRVGDKFLKTYNNDHGVGMLFTQNVLLCSVNRPLCLKTLLCLFISDDDNAFAEIIPQITFEVCADPDYVSDTCFIYRRIFSKEGVLQCSWHSTENTDGNLKHVSFHYMYRGLYDINKFIKHPRLLTLHMRDLKSDLTIYYSMLYNQFHAREDHIIGGSIMDAPISSKTYSPNKCDSCRDCRFWDY